MTPCEYLSDLPQWATELQKKELWSQKYAGRRIRWWGELWDVRENVGAGIEVSVRFIRPTDTISVYASFPAQCKADLLRYSRYDEVIIEGQLPQDFPPLGNIGLSDASVSPAT